jgi:hypothetical protein
MARSEVILVKGQEPVVVEMDATKAAIYDAKDAAYEAAEPARHWAAILSQRNALLAASDWRAMPDSPTMSADWTAYRQALRDVPSQSDPDNITFPEEPS